MDCIRLFGGHYLVIRLWARSIRPKFLEISVQTSMDRFGPTGKSFEKTGPPLQVVLFSRSDRSEFWLNGSRPLCALNLKTFSQTVMTDFLTLSYTPYRQLKGVSPGLRLVS